MTIEDRIRELVDQAPALSAEQRDRLRVLLRGDATAVATESGGGRVAAIP